MEADDLKAKKNILQRDIKKLVDNFIKEVGMCNIDIKTDFCFSNQFTKEFRLIKSYIIVNVTV
jgi:hypothetical protein